MNYQLADLLIKLAGVLAAFCFFAYKIAAGSLAAGTSLSISVLPNGHGTNRIGLVNVTVERGEDWTALVERAELTVVVNGQRGEPIPIEYKDPHRESFRLAPHEKTTYGAIIPLPVDKSAIVEALFVMQQQFFWENPGHVFASVAVPPDSAQ